MEASQNSYDVASPLLRLVPQTALDAVWGATALVTAELKLAVVSRQWDEFMSRSGRGDLARTALIGSSVMLFFRSDEQRRVFESLLGAMHSDELASHSQVVDMGSKEKPFFVQLHVQGLWQDGVFAGYFLHCMDVTREHANRLSLIERDREAHSRRDSEEKSEHVLQELREQLRAKAEEIAQREAQLKKLSEKTLRIEQSLKDALERAEKSVEKNLRLQHELDKLRKSGEDLRKLRDSATALKQQLTDITAEREAADAKCARLEQELHDLRQEKEAANSAAESANDARRLLAEMTAEREAADATCSRLERELDDLQKSVTADKAAAKTATAEIATLKERLEAAESVSRQVAELTAERDAAAEQCASLERDLAALRSRADAGKSATASAAQENADLKATCNNLAQELEHSRQECERLGSIAAQQKSLLDAANESHVLVQAIEHFLQNLSHPACWLNPRGQIECGTRAFFERIQATPERASDLTLASWLGEHAAATVGALLRQTNQFSCAVTSADGNSWLACLNLDTGGAVCGASIEAVAVVVDPAQESSTHDTTSHLRAISRELADQFNNLLTGVLGHASLAAADHDGPASNDILAIEKTARDAAQLVRKLSALGVARQAADVSVAAVLKQYVGKIRPEFFGTRPQLTLCEDECKMAGDVTALKAVLDAISAMAREGHDGATPVTFTLSQADGTLRIAVSISGSFALPAGWSDGAPPAFGQPGWDAVFGREVARGLGGDITLPDHGNGSTCLVTLPAKSSSADHRSAPLPAP